MPTALLRDASLETAFRRDGFVTCDLLDPDAVAALRACWEGAQADVKAYPFSSTILSADTGYREHVDRVVRETFAAPVAALLDDVRLAYGAFVAKRPGPDSAVPVHQDLSFVDEERYTAANVWVPLVDVTPANGCLRVLCGSHRLTRAPRGTDFGVPYLDQIDDDAFEDVPLRAGQACVMADALYHCSAANHSDEPRVAAAALAVSSDAPLLYFFAQPDRSGPRTLEVFAVPDRFYCYHPLGTRPHGLPPLAVDRRQHGRLTDGEIRARLAGAIEVDAP